jgi:hypothetical protein
MKLSRWQSQGEAQAAIVFGNFKKLSTLCVNCESTSSAMSIMSGSTKLKSMLPKVR